MAHRKKPSEERSVPFTTFNITLPLDTTFKISVCGTDKEAEEWRKLFKNKKISMEDLIVNYLIKDFKVKKFSHVINYITKTSDGKKTIDIYAQKQAKKIFNNILENLSLVGVSNNDNIQSYVKYCVHREIQKGSIRDGKKE